MTGHGRTGCSLHALAPILLLTFLALAAGCSGGTTGTGDGSSGSSGGTTSDTNAATPEAEAMFEAPRRDATPGSIYGVWGGTAEDRGITFHTRMKLATRSVTMAARCQLRDGRTSAVVAVTAAARVTDESVAVLESKTADDDDGAVRCGVRLTPRELKRCSKDPYEGPKRMCFELEGSSLTQYGESPLDKLEFTKLSD